LTHFEGGRRLCDLFREKIASLRERGLALLDFNSHSMSGPLRIAQLTEFDSARLGSDDNHGQAWNIYLISASPEFRSCSSGDYDEVQKFGKRAAKEGDWVPNAAAAGFPPTGTPPRVDALGQSIGSASDLILASPAKVQPLQPR
jgi:hypothetical protein